MSSGHRGLAMHHHPQSSWCQVSGALKGRAAMRLKLSAVAYLQRVHRAAAYNAQLSTGTHSVAMLCSIMAAKGSAVEAEILQNLLPSPASSYGHGYSALQHAPSTASSGSLYSLSPAETQNFLTAGLPQQAPQPQQLAQSQA